MLYNIGALCDQSTNLLANQFIAQDLCFIVRAIVIGRILTHFTILVSAVLVYVSRSCCHSHNLSHRSHQSFGSGTSLCCAFVRMLSLIFVLECIWSCVCVCVCVCVCDLNTSLIAAQRQTHCAPQKTISAAASASPMILRPDNEPWRNMIRYHVELIALLNWWQEVRRWNLLCT